MTPLNFNNFYPDLEKSPEPMQVEENKLKRKRPNEIAGPPVKKLRIKLIHTRPAIFPITKEAIAAQADLHRAMREARVLASQSVMIPLGTSVNNVYKLGVSAFFKVGRNGETATGFMETLIWDIAGLFNLEKHFVPTGQIKIHAQRDIVPYHPSNVQETFTKTSSYPEMELQLSDFLTPQPYRSPQPNSSMSNESWLEAEIINLMDKRFKLFKTPGEESCDMQLENENEFFTENNQFILNEDSMKKYALIWNQAGMLDKIDISSTSMKGGIQPAQDGWTLSDYEKLKASPLQTNPLPIIEDVEVVSAIPVTILFDMFDLHQKNVFITKEGKIKFFDNTRSLPNCNGWIKRHGKVVSSYRCCLLEMDVVHKPLTDEHRLLLTNSIAHFKLKYNKVSVFLNSPRKQKELQKLPPGWLNTKSSLEAMQERINLMERALKSESVQTLYDFVTESQPHYPLAFGLEIVRKLFESQQKNPNYLSNLAGYDEIKLGKLLKSWKTHITVGYDDILDVLDDCKTKFIDIEFVRSLAYSKGNLQFLQELVQYLNNFKPSTISPQEKLLRMKSITSLADSLEADAVIDNKDYCLRYCEEMIQENLQSEESTSSSSDYQEFCSLVLRSN